MKTSSTKPKSFFCVCRLFFVIIIRQRSEDEKNNLEIRIAETRKERDTSQNDCEELKVQLRLAEDRSENLQVDLQETSFKLKESTVAIFTFELSLTGLF